MNAFRIPEAAISVGVHSVSERKTSKEISRIQACAVVEVSLGCS